MLVRLLILLALDADDLSVVVAGDANVDDRLEIRGIFVGVSFVSMEDLG